MMPDEKNYNPTGKNVFVVYLCPRCHRTDCLMAPPKMKLKIPYFIQCDCGSWVMYHRAWITDPYNTGEIFAGFGVGDKRIMNIIMLELKEVTHILEPDGTMADMNVAMMQPGVAEELTRRLKDEESKRAIYR